MPGARDIDYLVEEHGRDGRQFDAAAMRYYAPPYKAAIVPRT